MDAAAGAGIRISSADALQLFDTGSDDSDDSASELEDNSDEDSDEGRIATSTTAPQQRTKELRLEMLVRARDLTHVSGAPP